MQYFPELLMSNNLEAKEGSVRSEMKTALDTMLKKKAMFRNEDHWLKMTKELKYYIGTGTCWEYMQLVVVMLR